MKPYNKLTRVGRLRRLRRLAQAALEAYGLSGARLNFLQYEGNVIYRVDMPGSIPNVNEIKPYIKNRYVLRILTTSDSQAVSSELTWLAALSQDAGLPVPEPIRTLDGRLLTTITIPEVPQEKIVSLMRWIDGHRLTKGFRPHHLRAWGQMVARMHKFAGDWKPPVGFNRPHWDWAGQLGGRDFRYPVDELVASMPRRFQEPFQIVSQRVQKVMQGLGKRPEAFGIIHSDMYPENILFKAGEVFPIDFEDCGFGYWMWDIAVALCYWPWTEDWYWMRDAFLEGYAQKRTLPDSQLVHLDLFMAAQYATMVLWASMFIKNDPAMRAEYEKWRDREGKKLLRYAELR